ncbi:hypothetical protein SAMN05660206_101483 [Sphingobacterium wenxiniae]|uniref:Uncharacterized protein n=1 Tax=Sphingobacterium wenxiniae TaxID=683125 RepID=A0A1I6PI34_9SPHI|nr:hypothetical protein SAMN05660206_101483 [Sphingobacterium wenxiniae]
MITSSRKIESLIKEKAPYLPLPTAHGEERLTQFPIGSHPSSCTNVQKFGEKLSLRFRAN